MPPLKNSRYEAFARDLAAGTPPAKAYAEHGWTGGPTNAAALARRPEIVRRVAEIAGEGARLAGIHAGYLQMQLLPLAKSNIADLLEADDAGRLKVRDLTKVDRETTASIAGLKVDGDGSVSLKLWDKNAAVSTLLRSIGALAPDRLEITGTDGGPVEIAQDSLPELELMRRYAFLLYQTLNASQDGLDQDVRIRLARAVRSTADIFLKRAEANEDGAAVKLIETELPPEYRTRETLISAAKTARSLLGDAKHAAALASGLREIADALMADLSARAKAAS